MINSWNDLYEQLWMRSAESRGLSSPADGSSPTAEVPQWPRSKIADVAAVVAALDPIIDSMPDLQGSHGTRRMWQAMVVELEAAAANGHDEEYIGSEGFWYVLLVALAYLEVIGAALPDIETRELLIASLQRGNGQRNASDATQTSGEKKWDSQQAEMISRRGFDAREPTGNMTGRTMKVPRTTNAEAIQIADYWTKQLQTFIVKVVLGNITNSMGLEGQNKRWSTIVDDIDHLARSGQPDDVYAKNHELWREALALAVNLDGWGEVPSPDELLGQSFAQSLSDLPDRLAKAAGAVAHTIGNVAHEAGAGLLAPLAKPLLIGGGVALGLILLLRRSPAETTHPVT
jgi:hypothetical protein